MKRKLWLLLPMLASIFVPTVLASCSTHISNNNPSNDNNSNGNDSNNGADNGNGDNTQKPPVVVPPINNETEYQLWTAQESKNNKFSYVGPDNKLIIDPGKGASDIEGVDFSDGRANALPLAGNIINKKYENLAKISYSVNFDHGGIYIGSAWLLDYQIPESIQSEKQEGNTYNDSNYPTKWYLATNSHVMDDLITPNSPYEETRSEKEGKVTSVVKLTKLVSPQFSHTKNDKYIEPTGPQNPNYKTYEFYQLNDSGIIEQNPAIRPVFLGFDYLKSQPSDFISNVPVIDEDVQKEWNKPVQEIADFSVFEIDFEKLTGRNMPQGYDSHKLAKEFTSNYANWALKDKYKIPEQSYLNRKNDLDSAKVYNLGFPSRFTPNYPNGSQITDDRTKLYIDVPSTLPEKEYENASSKFVKERHFNTFKNARGLMDSVLAFPDFGYKFQPPSVSLVAAGGVIPTIYQGLIYVDRNGDLDGGSSGSIFVDDDNYIQGIHFASDFTAHVGMSFSLLSEGYNYNGAYGVYNMQPYDLIRGGYENQKSSYLDQLRSLYKDSNIKTYIFNQGINQRY